MSTREEFEKLVLLVFGGDVPQEPLALHQIAARAVLVYLVGILVVRVGKSRLISRVTAVDVLLGFILGSLLSRGITGSASISGTAIGSAVLVAAHYVVTRLAVSNSWVGTIMKGRYYLLVDDGKCLEESLRQAHLSHHDLEEQLRLRGVASIDEVHKAWKERNGEVSVITKARPLRVVEVAVAQGVQTVRLEIGS
jgi:uncharacterized membrane protein YcaP (DUF421 family)